MIQYIIAGLVGATAGLLKDKSSKKSFAKGGRVSTYEYELAGGADELHVLGRKDGLVMFHSSKKSIKDSLDKAAKLLEDGYDEVLIGQPSKK